jgi:serine/threonine-protein kinase
VAPPSFPTPDPSTERTAAEFRLSPTMDAATRLPAFGAEDRLPRPARGRRVVVGLAAGASLAVAGALVAALWRPPPPSVPAAPPAPGLASTHRGTRLGDLPLPASSNPEAVAAYRAGLQAFADAAMESAQQSLERAVALDPTLGAAHLRLAFVHSLVVADEQDARRAYKKALGFRATLTPRDRALLDAFEPYFQRQPPDLAECERRMTAAVAADPDDPELAFYLGYVRFDRGQLATALVPFQRATELDPGFALAHSNTGGVLAYLGRFGESLEELDRCLKVSSAATDCLWYRALIQEQAGECEAEERELRRWIAKDQEDYYPYQMLAKALFSEGRPLETIVAAYEQKWAKLPVARRKREELSDKASVAIARGDFAAAEANLLALEREVAAEPGALAHAEPADRLVDLYLETGRPKLAARVADGYLKRLAAWTEPHRVDDRALVDDPQPRMHAALRRAGTESAEAFEGFRDRWLAAWRSKTSDAYVGYLWIYGFAQPAFSRADAERALAARANFPPLPPFLPQTLSLAHVARVHWLTGDLAQAIPLLRRATRVCVSIEQPYLHAQAALELGLALEETGDKPGACSAWKLVLDSWGAAKPRSVHADKAKAFSLKAGCK